ncbi:MAG: DivIVA domain-containing protein [Atopococcus tabaci]|uniref:DivIVA domain-containing protein n=1 Tax=Atopococcus tabaci TaxID=269774 RepID=A0AA43UCG0_9LACT|nr:DivIVA domain-containing protein [Atopococcus tabaci]
MLTSIEIRNQQFDSKMRGYNKEQVDTFLKDAAQSVEALTKENKELKEELDWALKRLDNYEEMQESLNKSILVAQDAADQLKSNSIKEADVIIADAQNQADTMIKEAVSEVNNINHEMRELRKHSRTFKQRLQTMIETQLELVESQEWDEVLKDPQYEFNEYKTISKDTQEKAASHEENTQEIEDDSSSGSFEYVSDPHSSQLSFDDDHDRPTIDLPESEYD